MTEASVVGAVFPNEGTTNVKTSVVAFVATATRRARRAAVRTGQMSLSGAKAVGRGIRSVLPYLGVIAAIAAGLALVAGIIALQVLWIKFLFTVSPILGWLVVGFMVLQAIGGVVYGVQRAMA